MRFTEIDVFGVYVAPMSLMMVAGWLVTIALRGEHRPASHAKHHAHITAMASIAGDRIDVLNG